MGKKVLILEEKKGSWASFLQDYFADVPALVTVVEEPSKAAVFFDRLLPGVLLTEPAFLNKAFLQKIRVRKHTDPAFRAYLLGDDTAFSKEPLFDAVFPSAPVAADFGRKFAETLSLPEVIRLLVVDDEEEIFAMVRDYFEGRKTPVFEIEHALNGKEALTRIAQKKPDVILLDIKMPVMDGRKFYVQFKKQGLEIPVIVFFDSVSGEELSEIRRYGSPAVVEKGYQGSSLSALMVLVKKTVYFS